MSINSTSQPASVRRLWKPILFVLIIIGLFVAAKVFHLGDRLEQMRSWIQSLGPWGPIAFIGIYVVATVAMIPGTVLTAAAGGLFGSVMGTIWVSIASTLGAAACFLIARYFARDAIGQWLTRNEKFRKLDTMTERQGAMIVAITRLVPLFPFNLLNYGFGLTRVRFGSYLLWSWLCMLPGTVLYVVGADAIVKAIREGRMPWVLIGVLMFVVIALVGVGYYARRRLKTIDSPTQENQP